MNTLVKSGDNVEKFENIIEECKKNKTKYVDQDFYPQKNIIDEDKKYLKIMNGGELKINIQIFLTIFHLMAFNKAN